MLRYNIGNHSCKYDIDNLLFCRDIHCVDHRDMICDLYNTVILSCIEAIKHILTTSKPSIKVKPGWNDNVQKLKMRLCHIIVYENLMVVQEKDILLKCVELLELVIIELFGHIEKNANTIRIGKMANALLFNKSRDMWSECAKMNGKKCKMASMIDGNSDSCSIAGIFSDQ